MTGRPDQAEEIARWVARAEADLRAAEILSTGSEVQPEAVCFHPQQSAEKILKALLISKGFEVPRSHDLVLLYRQLSARDRSAIRVEDLQPLNRYTIEARYPGDWEPILPQEAAEALEMARRRMAAVRHLLRA